MSRSERQLSPDVRSLLLNKLPDILSCEESEILPLLEYQPEVCCRLADAFERLTRNEASTPSDSVKKGSREWLRHTMASLPLRNIRFHEDGALSISPTSDASLRYLLLGYMPDHKAVTNKGVLNRELLSMSLFEQISEQGQALYGPITEWRADIGLSEEYALQGDVAIAKYIHLVETLFFVRYGALERELRALSELPKTQPTPIRFIEPLAKEAERQLRERLDRYVASVPSDAGTADDMIVFVLSHVAANRVLLESVCRDDLTKRGVQASVSLLRAMNDAGILEVPKLRSDAEIVSCLTEWFGREGRVSRAAGWDALSDESIAVSLEQATIAQDIYRRTRGARLVEDEPEAFNTPGDRLIFCLALLACYYGKVKVRQEVVGEHSSEYLVFPKRDERLRENPLSPNALEMVLTLFGQIAMSNNCWDLRADWVAEYARASSFRRGYLQSLIFDVFKRWTAPQLLALQAALEREIRQAEEQLQRRS